MSNPVKSIGAWLETATEQLRHRGVETARLDCLVLLGDLLGKDKSFVLSHPETELSAEEMTILENQIAQRVQHIPLAYIRGKSEFYGREFAVTPAVLEPRPESESIIDLLGSIAREITTVIDVGTGSGALAITAKLENSELHVTGVDIDKACLEIAAKNARAHRASVTFLQSNLLQGLDELELARAALLVNLPYVPDDYPLNIAATHEPKLAIFGGNDGLDLYRALFDQTADLPSKPLFIIAESLLSQHTDLEQIARKHGYTLEQTDGLVQLYKLV